MISRRFWMGCGMLAAAFAGGVAGSLICSMPAAHAQATAPYGKAITAEGLVIVDAQGRPRIIIGTQGQGAGISIKSEAGKDLLTLGGDPENVGMSLFFADGNGEAVSIGGDAKGNAGVGVHYRNGKECIGIGTGPDGTGIAVRTVAGADAFSIGLPPDAGVSLILKDVSGRVLWRVPR